MITRAPSGAFLIPIFALHRRKRVEHKGSDPVKSVVQEEV